jgi:hypothetical protein
MIKIKTFWRAETGIFLGIWLVLMVAGRGRLFSDPGPFWHIVVDPAQVDRWAREYGFEIALTEHGSGFDRYLESARGWSLVQRSRAATLYRKRSRSEKNPGY